jgi:hypothetical protein
LLEQKNPAGTTPRAVFQGLADDSRFGRNNSGEGQIGALHGEAKKTPGVARQKWGLFFPEKNMLLFFPNCG